MTSLDLGEVGFLIIVILIGVGGLIKVLLIDK